MTELGCAFALDDFGAGFGSFYYLKHLFFDYVKIDGEFVAHVHESAVDRTIMRSIVGIARDLGKRTVAEFVSEPEILEVCRDRGRRLRAGLPDRQTGALRGQFVASSSCHPPSGRRRTTERCGTCAPARDSRRQGDSGSRCSGLQRSVGLAIIGRRRSGAGVLWVAVAAGDPEAGPCARRGPAVRHLAGLLRHRDARATGAARRSGRRAAARGRGRRPRAAPADPGPAQRGRRPDAAGAQARDDRDPRGVRRRGDHHRAHPGAQRGGLHLRDPGLAAVAVAAARRGSWWSRTTAPTATVRLAREAGVDVYETVDNVHKKAGGLNQALARGAPRPGRQRLRDDHGRRHHARRRLPRGRGQAPHQRPGADGGRRPVLRRGRLRPDRPVPAQRVHPLPARPASSTGPGVRAHRHRVGVPAARAARGGRGARQDPAPASPATSTTRSP